MYIDTHCHIHDHDFFTPEAAEAAYQSALEAGVSKMMLVGTSLKDSKHAITFAKNHPGHFGVAVGIHPHEAAKLSEDVLQQQLDELDTLANQPEVNAIGECGFDFYYNDPAVAYHSQRALLEGQLAIAQRHALPLSFHVREALTDFWPVFEAYPGVKGVLHSFTDTKQQLEKALGYNLYIGINGIATFTNHTWQLELFKTLPLENIVIETDAPFLTPTPLRGTINTPKNVIYITKFLAELRGEDVRRITDVTTANARKLFGL